MAEIIARIQHQWFLLSRCDFSCGKTANVDLMLRIIQTLFTHDVCRVVSKKCWSLRWLFFFRIAGNTRRGYAL